MGKLIKQYAGILVLMLVKQFAIPIVIITVIIVLIGAITEILNIEYEEDKNLSEELSYYEVESSKIDFEGMFESVKELGKNIFNIRIFNNMEWPVVGHSKITSEFGYREAPTAGASTYHSGIDIAAPEGAEIVSLTDGIVTYLGFYGAGGYTVTIKSNDGIYTFSYSHISPNYIVELGEDVRKGQVIGEIGPKNVYGVPGNPYVDSNGNPTNGATTGTHLHFSIRENGILIDPLTKIKY